MSRKRPPKEWISEYEDLEVINAKKRKESSENVIDCVILNCKYCSKQFDYKIHTYHRA